MSNDTTATTTTDLDTLTPGVWTIDAAHTTVGFVVRHLMVSKVRGRFGAVSGEVHVSPEPLESTVSATIETASISTGDETRDQHLRSSDFFDVEQFPTMTFQSTGVRRTGSGYVLVGEKVKIELDVEAVKS
jgi:polyisoprenoid-binding protein YceI